MRHKILLMALIIACGFIAACAKNNETGKYEPDYPTIANVGKITSHSLTFEGLKWLYQNKPTEVTPTYADLTAVMEIINNYSAGNVTVGNVVGTITKIFDRINGRFALVNSDVAAMVSGFIAGIGGTLNIVITAVPANALLVLNGISAGINEGLTQFAAWQAAQVPPVGGV